MNKLEQGIQENTPVQQTLLNIALRASQAIEGNGALRSALRRASSTLEVIGHEQVDAFGEALKHALVAKRLAGLQSDAIADGAMILLAQRNVLSFKKAQAAAMPAEGLLAQCLGEKQGERRRLSELRFQRLLRAIDTDDRLQQMRRALALLNAPAHPLAILQAWLDLHTEPGRRRFARAYFSGSSAHSASIENSNKTIED